MVRLDNLTVSYRQHPALHHISGRFADGSLTAVAGPNGSGKSTLLKSIVGLLAASGGSVAVTVPREHIAYLPQLAEIDRSFPISVFDCVLLGCWAGKGAWKAAGNAELARVGGALKAVALDGFEHRQVASLSSGQLQRMLFARLLVQNARLILLDEPFNAMDGKTTAALLALVKQWHAEQRTVIAVIHDQVQMRGYFPQTLLLARQVVAWGATSDVLAEAWDEDAGLCQLDSQLALEARRPGHSSRLRTQSQTQTQGAA
jgi:zinc/manganese transport system ATP-binding protein